jgi:hypothetical protein
MKKILSLAVMMLSFACAQAQVTVQEPEFIGQVRILTSDSTSVLLPKEKSVMKTKSTHFGMIPIPGAGLLDKTKTNMVLQGKESAVTVPAGTIRFIMRVEKTDVDPSTYLRIVKFDQKKKTRETTIAQMGLLQGFSMDMNSSDTFEVQKYGENCLLFTLRDVQVGQYGISFTALMESSTFGVQ